MKVNQIVNDDGQVMEAKVNSMTNDNGRAIPNQFILRTPSATYFQSYDSIIVKTTFEGSEGVVTLDEQFWDYSNTTGKYRNLFLGEKKKDTLKKIESGQYRLADLNQ